MVTGVFAEAAFMDTLGMQTSSALDLLDVMRADHHRLLPVYTATSNESGCALLNTGTMGDKSG